MPKKPSHCSEELTDFIFLKLLTFYQKFGKDKHIAIESKVNIMSYRSKILLLDLIHILFILFMQKTTGAWSYKEGALIIILWIILLVISVVMLWKYHCSQNGLLNNVIIVISVIIIFFSILNVLPSGMAYRTATAADPADEAPGLLRHRRLRLPRLLSTHWNHSISVFSTSLL